MSSSQLGQVMKENEGRLQTSLVKYIVGIPDMPSHMVMLLLTFSEFIISRAAKPAINRPKARNVFHLGTSSTKSCR